MRCTCGKEMIHRKPENPIEMDIDELEGEFYYCPCCWPMKGITRIKPIPS